MRGTAARPGSATLTPGVAAAVRREETVKVPSAAKAASTSPTRSVRRMRAPEAAIRPSVSGFGWPNVLPAPTDTTATAGRSASSSAAVVAVRLPWWATLRRATVGSPRASRCGSTSCSASPVRRKRRPSTVPRSTIETLLTPDPVSGGSRGTVPGSGHRTESDTSSTRSSSPVASRPHVMAALASPAVHAPYAGPAPRMPGS